MGRDISIAITAKDNFTQTIATMRSTTQAFNKDMDALREKINAANKTKINLKIDTAKSDLGNMNQNINALVKNAAKAQKSLNDLGITASKVGNRKKLDINVGKTDESVISGISTGDFLKNFTSIAVDTLSKGVTTYMTSALGSEGGTMAKNVLETGINGAEIGLAAGGPIGAAVGLAIGASLGAINGAIENYAAEDEKYKSYVKDQYENIVQTRSNTINTASSLAASHENADDPSSFTGTTKALNDAKSKVTMAMGNAYNEERANGKGGLNDQINSYNGKNGQELQKLNVATGKWEAELENEKDQYQMDAQNALFGGKISKRFSKEEKTQLREYQKEYKEAEAAYDKGDTSQAATMRELLEATNALAANSFSGSDKAQKEKKSDEALVKNLQASAKKSEKGWKNVSSIEQLLSKGRASVGYNDPVKWDKRNGKMAYGLSYVPYNNFPALLHEGERVLTASENRGYKSGTGVTITGNNFTIREDADITKVAKALFREIEKARMVMAV